MEHVPDALVRSLPVVVLDILIDDKPQPPLAEDDHPIETLLLDRSDETLRVRVQVRAPGRQPDRADVGGSKQAVEGGRAPNAAIAAG